MSVCVQRVSCVCDMLATMKLLCLAIWPDEVKKIDELRLKIVLSMLKSPHFNARMNALKEVRLTLSPATTELVIYNQVYNLSPGMRW